MCSNFETKKFLEKLNVQNIFFKGNIKFIGKVDEKKIKSLNEKFFSTNKFWFAASTHEEEEIFCLKTHLILKKKYFLLSKEKYISQYLNNTLKQYLAESLSIKSLKVPERLL